MKSVFLYGKLEQEVYLAIPKGVTAPSISSASHFTDSSKALVVGIISWTTCFWTWVLPVPRTRNQPSNAAIPWTARQPHVHHAIRPDICYAVGYLGRFQNIPNLANHIGKRYREWYGTSKERRIWSFSTSTTRMLRCLSDRLTPQTGRPISRIENP